LEVDLGGVWRVFVFLWILCGDFLHGQVDSSSEMTLLIIGRHNFRGEIEFAERIKLACKKLNWTAEITDMFSRSVIKNDYRFALVLAPGMDPNFKDNYYLVLFDPVHHYFDSRGRLLQGYSRYGAYLATYEDTEVLQASVGDDRIYPKRWYPTVHFIPYRVVVPDQLFYFIGQWGERAFSQKYQTMQRLLAQKSYTNFYGNETFGKRYRSAFKGPIAFDGEMTLDLISEKGVCLVLHSQAHIVNQIPSCRIFEAAASSAVIISDLNPFVVKHFGDSVLYIDQTRSGEEIFEQVDAHMDWIRKHQEEALQMARQAHDIFEANFLLEDQLIEFAQFYFSEN